MWFQFKLCHTLDKMFSVCRCAGHFCIPHVNIECTLISLNKLRLDESIISLSFDGQSVKVLSVTDVRNDHWFPQSSLSMSYFYQRVLVELITCLGGHRSKGIENCKKEEVFTAKIVKEKVKL